MKTKIYSKKEFFKYINKNKYQVFLFSCPVPIPFNVARHYWFVINKKGKLERWEVNFPKNNKKNYGFIWTRKNNLETPFNKYWWKAKPKFKFSLLEGVVDGETAKKLILEIENSIKRYPYKNKYLFYKKPNSNTYVQWILNKVPEIKWKLSWRAIGK